MSKPEGQRWTIAVDFDGVLHSYTSPWVSADVIPDPPVEGAIEWLNEIGKKFDVVIHTTRGKTADGQLAVVKWLVAHGYQPPVGQLGVDVTAEKPAALVYIDDRAWRFTGPGSFPTAGEIHSARPWNKPRPPVDLVDETDPNNDSGAQG